VSTTATIYFNDFETSVGSFTGDWTRSTITAIAGTWSLRSSNQGVDSSTSQTQYTFTLSSTAVMRFKYRYSSELSFDGIFLYADSTKLAYVASYWWPPMVASGPNGTTTTMIRLLLPGAHTFRAVFHKDNDTAAGSDSGWIDDFLLVRADASEANVAFYNSFETDSTGFTGGWTITTVWSADGTKALASGNAGVQSSTSVATFTITLTASAYVAFNWRVSSETNYDKFYAALNGTNFIDGANGATGTAEYVCMPLSSGTAVFTFTYIKDGSTDTGDDRAFIDNFLVMYKAPGAAASTTASYVLTASAGAYAYAGVAATPLHDRLLTSSATAYAYSGQDATILVTHLLTAEAGAYTLSGQTASIYRGFAVSAEPGNFAISGQDATILKTRILTGEAGAYDLSGQDIGVYFGYTLTGEAGAYTYAGQDATISKTRILTADAGAYSLGGQAASILKSTLLTAAAGAYTYAGQDATVAKGYLLTAAAGAYTLAGQDATILRSKVLTASAGAYTLAGQDATILKSKVLSAGAGSYALAGQDATVTYLSGRILIAEAGSYTLTGQSANLLRSYVLTADAGAYNAAGQSASITLTVPVVVTAAQDLGAGSGGRRRKYKIPEPPEPNQALEDIISRLAGVPDQPVEIHPAPIPVSQLSTGLTVGRVLSQYVPFHPVPMAAPTTPVDVTPRIKVKTPAEIAAEQVEARRQRLRRLAMFAAMMI